MKFALIVLALTSFGFSSFGGTKHLTVATGFDSSDASHLMAFYSLGGDQAGALKQCNENSSDCQIFGKVMTSGCIAGVSGSRTDRLHHHIETTQGFRFVAAGLTIASAQKSAMDQCSASVNGCSQSFIACTDGSVTGESIASVSGAGKIAIDSPKVGPVTLVITSGVSRNHDVDFIGTSGEKHLGGILYPTTLMIRTGGEYYDTTDYKIDDEMAGRLMIVDALSSSEACPLTLTLDLINKKILKVSFPCKPTL